MSEDLDRALREELFPNVPGFAATSERDYHLEKVHYWLRYEGLAPVLFFGAFWLPVGLIAASLFISAYIFTPFMLYHFWKARYYKAIVVFSALVLLPFLLSFVVPSSASLGYLFLRMGPLVVFFIFTWTMKLILGERLSESRAVREIEQADHYRANQ